MAGYGSVSPAAPAPFLPPPPPRVVAALGGTTVVSTPEDASLGDGIRLIGTHDGTFHCDEALACAMLKTLPEYETAVVVRTRDPAALEKCDVVVDVGAVYDPTKHRYDHHQREFEGTMKELGHGTKLSSAGLVYRHFGRQVVSRLVDAAELGDAASVDIDALYRKTYKSFIEHIDGIDNGVEAFNGGSRNYEVSTTLSGRVGDLNPRWNEPSGHAEANARFAAALSLTGAELSATVLDLARSWWPGRALVAAALGGAAENHPSRQILTLAQFCPWTGHLFQLEEERKVAGQDDVVGVAKFIIYQDTKGGWRVQAVPVEEQSFTSRLALPEPWRGVRDEALSKLTGIDGCVFVHAAGFIGGNSTREGALAMALKAIES